jgi:hypothetical protein
MPPITTGELYSRRQIAAAMLRALPELVTPLGHLYIDGYRLDDWVEPRDLAGSLPPMARGQVHLFSADEALRATAEFRPLVSAGVIVFHEESLLDVISWGRERGLLEEARKYADVPSAFRVSIAGGKICRFELDVWNRLRRSLLILDDDVMRSPEPLSPERRYMEFREFLRGTSSSPRWSDCARGFAFLREAERAVENEVRTQLASQELRAKCVVLYGQSGTGKTVAMIHMAYRFKQIGTPVGYISRRFVQPDFSDVDLFCEALENLGATRTLIVWDGMLEAARYNELADYLASRGRRAVIVGSSYRQSGEPTPAMRGISWVEMPPSFSRNEAETFCRFLKTVDQLFDESPEDVHRMANGRFLVALFRLLPETRSQIRAGLLREYQAAEERIEKVEGKTEGAGSPPAGSFGDLLRVAIAARYPELLKRVQISSPEGLLPESEHLTGLILVPGRFGLNTPIELVTRSAGHYGYEPILRVLRDVDVFLWDEDKLGNITIGPRHPLEAVEVLNARYGSPLLELEFVKRLLLEIKAGPTFEDDSGELQFAVGLIRAVGPQGVEPERYSYLMGELLGILRQIREQRGMVHPALLFLEGNVAREWAKRLQSRPGSEIDQLDVLSKGQEVLEKAVREVEPLAEKRRARSFLANAHVELAALHGARLVALTRLGKDRLTETATELRRARFHVEMSQRYRPSNYYPLDVLFWVSRDYLAVGLADEKERSEILADLVNAFDRGEVEEFESTQQNVYEERRVELSDLIDDESMKTEALARLAEQGSMGGVFIVARNMAYGGLKPNLRHPLSREAAAASAVYLESQGQNIKRDARCLGLLLRLKWWLFSGKMMFEGERITPGLNRDQWTEILGLVEGLLGIEAERSSPSMLFIRGIALFHLERFIEAEDQFRELDRLFVPGRRRVVAHYLYSDEKREPIRLSGTVRWINPDGTRGSVYCPRIRRDVNFVPQDFRKPEIRVGDALDVFHISFRFRGLLAEDVRFYRRHSEG